MKSGSFPFCLAALSLLAACSGPSQPPPRSISPQPAPDFNLQTLEGQQLSSDNLRGKIVVLNFWAPWSPASAREIPELVQLRENLKSDRIVLVGVCLESKSMPDLQQYIQDMKFNYPVAVVDDSFYEKFGGIDAIPSTLVIDPNWQLVNRYTGKVRIEDLEYELEFMLNELNNKK